MTEEKTQAQIAVKSRVYENDNVIRFWVGPTEEEPRQAPDDFILLVTVRLEAIAADEGLFRDITEAVKAHVVRVFPTAGSWTSFKTHARGN